jgi:hypothetical protein
MTKEPTLRKFDMLRTIFIDGETTMSVVWLHLLLGLMFGLAIRRCG